MQLDCWLAFDCETVAIADAAEYLEPVSAPSNYKDAEKIAAYIVDAGKRQREKAALDVDLARIVALALQTDQGAQPHVMLCRTEREEVEALESFWGHVRVIPNQVLVGFYIRAYDIPLIVRRSQLLGVRYPDLNMDRYRTRDYVDLHETLTFHGTIDGKKLTTYCKRFGLQMGEDVTGAQIAECVAKDDWAAIAAHAYADVCRVVALGRAIGVLAPVEIAEVV